MSNKNTTPVTVNLLATVKNNDGTPPMPMQLLTTGVLEKGNDAWVLRYNETAEDEDGGEPVNARITLTMKKDQVIMEREGPFSNTMVFIRGRRFEGLYNTPYGDMPMSVYTHQVSTELSRDAGTVKLRYQLDMEGTYTSTNDISISYMR